MLYSGISNHMIDKLYNDKCFVNCVASTQLRCTLLGRRELADKTKQDRTSTPSHHTILSSTWFLLLNLIYLLSFFLLA